MRQVIRRFFVLASTSLFTQAIALVALAFVTRRVGPSALGSYTVALAIVTFIGLPQTQGMTMVGTRDVAQNPSRVREIVGEVLIVQMIIAVVGFVLIWGLAPVLAPNPAMQTLLPIVATFLFTGTSFEWTMQALGKMREIAIARVVGQVAYGALVPVLVGTGLHGAETFAWLMIGGLALKHVILDYYLLRHVGLPRLRITREALRRRVGGSLAIGYTTVVAQIYGTIDQIMVGYFSSAFDAGEYATAYRIPNAVGSFAGSWGSAVFPHSAALAVNDRGRLRTDSARMLSAVALFAIPLAACTPFIARPLLSSAFGGEYAAGATAFSLLTVAVSIGLMNGTFTLALRGMGKDRFFAGTATITMLLNVIINLAAIPLFGRDGAAVASIFSESVATGMLIFGADRLLGGIPPEWNRLTRIALATVPAVLALRFLPEFDVWLRIVMATVVYLVGTVVFGAVSRTELAAALGLDRFASRRPARPAGPAGPAGRAGPAGPADEDRPSAPARRAPVRPQASRATETAREGEPPARPHRQRPRVTDGGPRPSRPRPDAEDAPVRLPRARPRSLAADDAPRWTRPRSVADDQPPRRSRPRSLADDQPPRHARPWFEVDDEFTSA